MQTKQTINEQKIIGLLGFARKAGKVVLGADRIKDALRKNDRNPDPEDTTRPLLKNNGMVLIASDASGNTRKKLTDGCAYHNTDCFVLHATMGELSELLGKTSDTSAVGIFDCGFASAIRKIIKAGEPCVKKTIEERNGNQHN